MNKADFFREARRILAEIYGWFTEGFDTKDFKRRRRCWRNSAVREQCKRNKEMDALHSEEVQPALGEIKLQAILLKSVDAKD